MSDETTETTVTVETEAPPQPSVPPADPLADLARGLGRVEATLDSLRTETHSALTMLQGDVEALKSRTQWTQELAEAAMEEAVVVADDVEALTEEMEEAETVEGVTEIPAPEPEPDDLPSEAQEPPRKTRAGLGRLLLGR